MSLRVKRSNLGQYRRNPQGSLNGGLIYYAEYSVLAAVDHFADRLTEFNPRFFGHCTRFEIDFFGDELTQRSAEYVRVGNVAV